VKLYLYAVVHLFSKFSIFCSGPWDRVLVKFVGMSYPVIYSCTSLNLSFMMRSSAGNVPDPASPRLLSSSAVHRWITVKAMIDNRVGLLRWERVADHLHVAVRIHFGSGPYVRL
jgi:hypothetical protein